MMRRMVPHPNRFQQHIPALLDLIDLTLQNPQISRINEIIRGVDCQ
jgi:hypothetical protein